MESRTIILGDHTGSIKVLDPEIHNLGPTGQGLGIINIIPSEEGFYAFRSLGSVDRFTLEGTFTSVHDSSKKIIDGAIYNNSIILAYPNGEFGFNNHIYKTAIQECSGISNLDENLALCGDNNAEVWDLNKQSLKWKAWTFKPKDPVFDSKCWIDDRKFYVATTKNEVRIHDFRAKKPQGIIMLNKEGHGCNLPISCLYVFEDNLYVGDVAGHMYKLNKELKILGKTKIRSVGALQSIYCKESNVYSCGLDRRLMIHDCGSLKLVEKKYLWQKLTKVIVL